HLLPLGCTLSADVESLHLAPSLVELDLDQPDAGFVAAQISADAIVPAFTGRHALEKLPQAAGLGLDPHSYGLRRTVGQIGVDDLDRIPAAAPASRRGPAGGRVKDGVLK